MAKLVPAKTPAVAIGRVLRALGLKQGTDFSVTGRYCGGERIATVVTKISKRADEVIAANADWIETATKGQNGWVFAVSIHRLPTGGFWTAIDNGGGVRTRDEIEAPADEPRKTLPGVKFKLGEAQPAFEQPEAATAPDRAEDPYDGLRTMRVDNALWACEESGKVWFFQMGANAPRYTLRVYKGRARLSGWYLTGPGIEFEGRWMGDTVSVAARAAKADIVGADFIARSISHVESNWPKGTRVQGVDSHGVTCSGTVSGLDVGVVTRPGHKNCGRTYLGVDWDEMPHNRSAYARRSRPFVDQLIRI